MTSSTELELVWFHIDTWLVTDENRRILHCTDPKRSPGPRLEIAGSRSGNIVLILDGTTVTGPDDRHRVVRGAPVTDEEYLWEPAPDCWTVRPAADGTFRGDRGLNLYRVTRPQDPFVTACLRADRDAIGAMRAAVPSCSTA